MDWNTTEGKDLLLQAYPAGFLLVPGLATVGGWRCLNVVPGDVSSLAQGEAWWGYFGTQAMPPGVFIFPVFVHMALNVLGIWRDREKRGEEDGGDAASLRQACRRGALLPLPDRNDHATWACLLADLWQAMGGTGAHGGLALDAPSDDGEPWDLTVGIIEGSGMLSSELPVLYGDSEGQTRDPEVAVILARIHYRKLGR